MITNLTLRVLQYLVGVVFMIGGFAVQSSNNIEAAIRGDLSQASDGRVHLTDDKGEGSVAFDITAPDGSIQIHCDGTIVKNPNGRYTIAPANLTPNCATELATVNQG